MSASIGSEEIKKMIQGNSTEQMLGAYGGHSPLLDLVERMSGDLNQQTAESNLYRGGAGYGGSFMNKDQLAARAAGKTLSAKPYGGWGGYGSSNTTMMNRVDPNNNGAGIATPSNGPPGGYGQVGGGVTPGGGGAGGPGTGGPGGGMGGLGGLGTGGGDTGGSDSGSSTYLPIGTGPTPGPRDLGGSPIVAGGGVMPTGPYGGGGITPPPGSGGAGPLTGGGGLNKSNPYAAMAMTMDPTRAPTWGGNLKPGDPGWNPAWVGGGPSGGGAGEAGGGYLPYVPPGTGGGKSAPTTGGGAGAKSNPTKTPGMQEYSDPNVQAIYEAMVAKGVRPDFAVDADSIRGMIAQGASPGIILKNYMAVIDRMGPGAFSAMHGQIGAMNGNVEDLTNGKWLQGALSNAGVDPGPLTNMGKLDDPMPNVGTKTTTGTAAPGNENPNSQAPQGGGGPPTVPGQPTAPPGSSGYGTDGKPYVNPHPWVTGYAGTGMDSRGMGDQTPPWLDPGRDGYDPKAGDITEGEFDPTQGKDWGTQSNPPKGMKVGDTYTLPDGKKQVMTADGRFSSWYVDSEGKAKYGWMTDGLNGELLPNLEAMRPVLGGRQIIGYDEEKNPIYNDDPMFEQGNNGEGVGDNTPDAWSNSPEWRPEEPTGGLYGAYTELASGKMTDYENEMGKRWQDMASNPATADDLEYRQLVKDYNSTPGIGIQESYDAYNTMINSNGYSDAEKGAMEGSAARGLSQGFARGADEIRRQAARTGNRAAAYSALSGAGAKYGADAGEMNRQNQIKFADEAQRRKEAGASGMTNVAGLSNTRSQIGLSAASDYTKEMQRRKEAAVKGMGDFSTYGRGLQSQGLAGLQGMLNQSNSDKNNTYAQIAAILGTKTGKTASEMSKQNTDSSNIGLQI